MSTALAENEIGLGGAGDATGSVIDMLRATGASDHAVLEALELAADDLTAGSLYRYMQVSFVPTGRATHTILASFDFDLLRRDIAAAAHKHLVG